MSNIDDSLSMLNLPRQDALAILRLLVRPIVRFCIRHAISIQELESVARGELVKVTHAQMKRRGEKINASRLSVTTGVYRKEIDRILSERAPEPAEPPGILARIIGRWEQHPSFCAKNGGPRPLTYKGPDSEFAALAASVTTALGPAAVLFALQRKGLVKEHGGKLRLLLGGNVSSDDALVGFRIASSDIQTLLDAVEENLEKIDPLGQGHIRTEYDNIYEEDLPKIKEWLNAQVRLLHRRTRKFLSQFDKDINPKKSGSPVSGAFVALTTASFAGDADRAVLNKD